MRVHEGEGEKDTHKTNESGIAGIFFKEQKSTVYFYCGIKLI